MPGFKRVFLTNPGNTTLNEIESVDVIDSQPPSLSFGAGTGTVGVVGEFERGALNQPIEIFSSADQRTKVGGLGFPSSVHANDGAVARKSGGNENWNGNGFIWTQNKRFNRLVLCRVDNSAGNVDFRRLACLSGGAGPFSSSTTDQVVFELDGGPTTATAIVTGAKARLDAVGASYPVSISGLTLEVVVDADVTRIITFSTETALSEVVARINAVLAQTVASENSGQIRMESVIAGGAGFIQVIGGTARATLGFPTAVIKQVDTSTVNSVTAGVYTLRVQVLVAGQLTNFDGSFTRVSETATQLRDALLAAMEGTLAPGITFTASGSDDIVATGDDNITFTSSVEAEPTPSDVTIVLTTAAVVNAEFGTGNVLNLSSYTVSEIATVIDAVANLSGSVDADGLLRVCNTLTSATGKIEATSGVLVATLGFTIGVVADAAIATDVTILAGTVVQGTSPTTKWITLEDVVTGTAGGPFNAKVRPFSDTDEALANGIGTITTVVSTLDDGFVVTNAAAVTRLSQPQLDARYQTALDSTLDLNTPAAEVDFIASARSSSTIMRALLDNAELSTSKGLAPRKALVRPLLGTTIVDAQASTGQGVGIQRNQRRQYLFPGWTTVIAEIANVGTKGGTGFTATGEINVGSDSFFASIVSILNPEENAGQQLTDTNVGTLQVLALEDAFNKEKGGASLTITEYIAFKAAGITAPKLSKRSGPLYQSDVTTVDPSTDLILADGSRRRMADFIIKSLQDIAAPYVKKLNIPKRRQALTNAQKSFLRDLQSPDNPDATRIQGFSVTDISTANQLAAGIQAFSVKVQTYSAMTTVLLNVVVGTTVVIEEAA